MRLTNREPNLFEKREQINQIKTFADGVVVGSALLDCISQSSQQDAASNAKKFIQNLKSKEW